MSVYLGNLKQRHFSWRAEQYLGQLVRIFEIKDDSENIDPGAPIIINHALNVSKSLWMIIVNGIHITFFIIALEINFGVFFLTYVNECSKWLLPVLIENILEHTAIQLKFFLLIYFEGNEMLILGHWCFTMPDQDKKVKTTEKSTDRKQQGITTR